jgi:hypothetical protein
LPRRAKCLRILALAAAYLAALPAATLAQAPPQPVTISALGAHIEMVHIPPGHFRMGTDSVITGPKGWTNESERRHADP